MARFYRRRPRSRKAYRKRKTFDQKVKAIVRRQQETKDKKYDSGILTMKNFANSNPSSNTIELTPNSSTLAISQGTAESQRIGNMISTQKAYIKLRMSPLPYNGTSNSIPIPQIICIVIWSIKESSQTLASAQSIAQNDILQNNNSDGGFSGSLTDWMRDFNTDLITVHKKMYVKCGASVYSSNTGNQANQFNYANNDFPLTVLKNIDITKYYPKRIRFNDNDNDGNARNVFLTVSPMDADGGANPDGTSAVPMEWEYGLHLKYKDA